MGVSGFGQPLANTFGDMLKISNQNQGVDTTPRTVSDTRGQDTALQIAKNQVRIIPVDSDGEVFVVLTKDGTPIFLINTATKEVIAATGVSFVGDGSRLAGITGATGGISNDATTNIVANALGDGNGDINFSIYNTLLMTLRNNGGANGGSWVIKSLNKDLLAALTGDEVAYVNVNGVASIQDANSVHPIVLTDKWGAPKGGLIFDGTNSYVPLKDQTGVKEFSFTVMGVATSGTVGIATLGTGYEVQVVDGVVTLGASFTNTSVYVNGVPGSTITGAKDFVTVLCDEMSISGGKIGTDGTNYGAFRLLSWRTYNYQESADEIKAMWNNGEPEKAVVPFELRGASNKEVVADNDFNDATKWITSADVTVDDVNSKAVFNMTDTSYQHVKQPKMLRKGKRYKLVIEITAYTSGDLQLIGAFSTDKALTGLEGDGAIAGIGTYEYYFEVENPTGYLGLARLVGTTCVLEIGKMSVIQIGNVAEYRGENMGANGAIDTSGNNLHGQNVGAVSMSDNSRDVVVGIGADGQATDVVPQNAILEYIQIKNTSEFVIAVNIGTSALGSDVGSATVNAGEIATLQVNKTFSDTSATTLYISDADGDNSWGGATLNVFFYNKTLGA